MVAKKTLNSDIMAADAVKVYSTAVIQVVASYCKLTSGQNLNGLSRNFK
jgi:hypothetical protein